VHSIRAMALALLIASFGSLCALSAAGADTERSLSPNQVASSDGVWSLAPTSNAPAVDCSPGPLPKWSVRDSKRNRLLVMMADATTTSLQSLDLGTYAWSTIVPAGTPPTNWSGEAVVYDPTGDQVLFFGGNASGGLINQIWALQLTGPPQWVQVVASGDAPTPRQGAGAVLDTRRNRMIVGGGTSNDGGMTDVWALDLPETQWSQLFPSGTPAQLHGTAVYDELSDRIIQCNESSPISILSLGDSPAWSTAPGPGVTHGLKPCYEGARNRIIGIEGAELYSSFRYWACDLATFAWTELHPSGALPVIAKSTSALVLCFDPSHNLLVEFGEIGYTGLGFCQRSNATYLWSFGAPDVSVDPNPSQPGRSALLTIQPSPGGATQTISFRIASTDVPRMLEIYSVDGRRVWQASLVGRASGLQTLSWNGRAVSGRRVQAGVYLARLVSNRGTSTQRFVRR